MYEFNQTLLVETASEIPSVSIFYYSELPFTLHNTGEIIETFPKMGETIKLSKGTLLTNVPNNAFVMQRSYISRDAKGYALDIVITGYDILYGIGVGRTEKVLPRVAGKTQTFYSRF